MASDNFKTAAVVGGGISGLTAAWALHRAGFRVTVFEKHARVGGNIQTLERDGWLVEKGPNTLQCQPIVSRLLEELDLSGQRALANASARKRFIVRHGQLIPVPLSPARLLTSPLFTLRSRLRVLLELTHRPRIRTTDTSLASFIAAHFGQEIVDYGLSPFVSGIYAGDPDKLSARHSFPTLWQLERTHGSLLRGLRAQAAERRTRGEGSQPPIISFPHGLGTLPQTIASRLPAGAVRTDEAVTMVIPGKPWKLISTRGGAAETSEFHAVVLALPADALAALAFGTLGERPLASLENVPQPPVSTLFLGFPRAAVAHPLDGFGALVPAKEQRQILGVLFSSTLFPGRAPADHVALTVFAGGSKQPEIGRLDTQQLIATVLPDLRALLGVTGEPVFSHHTFWPRAIPQYKVGHERFLEPLSQSEIAHDGLYFATNARDGISLPSCIKNGYDVAEKAAAYLARQ